MVIADLDSQLEERGYLAMSRQTVDATLVAAPKQRNTVAKKEAIKADKAASEIWPEGARLSCAEGHGCALVD